MRKKIFIIASAAAIGLTGCASVPTLSEQQNDAIAEYVADSLLKHDKNYSSMMKYDEEAGYATPIPSVQPTAVPVVSASPVSTVNPGEDSDYSENIPNGKDTGQSGETVDDEKQYVSLSEAMQIPGFKVKMKGYEYSRDISTKDSNISSSPGNKLLVLKIKLTNDTNGKKKIDMTKNHSKYMLTINGKQMASPLLTIAGEDIHFIKKSVASKKSINAILVFEISEKTKMKDIVLEVTNNDAVAQVNIK